MSTPAASQPRGAFWRESLLAFGPHAGAHRVAIRATLSTLVPLATLVLLGRPEWAPWAAFGAFTALYGRNRVHLSRLTMQLTAAAVLVSAVGLGSLVAALSSPTWVMVVGGAALAAVVSVIADAEDWHPPGPLFALFAFSGSASLPGGTMADAGTATVVALASAGFAVLVGAAGTALRRISGAPAPRVALTRDWTLRAGRRVQLRRVARYAIGVLLAGAIAVLLGIGHPYWAMVSAVVPVSTATFAAGAVRGTHRILGTTLGVLVAAGLLALEPSPFAVALLIGIFTFGAELLVGRNYGIAMVCITPLALLAVHLASPTPAIVLLVDRLVESVVGATVGILVGFATRGWAPKPG